MKRFFLSSGCFFLVLLLLANTGCGDITGDKTSQVTAEKQAVDILAEFTIVNQLGTLQLLEIFSEGFTQPLFSPQVSISDADYELLYNIMAETAAYNEAVTASLTLLVPPEYTAGSGMVPAGISPFSGLARQAVSPGIFDSFTGFFGFLGDAGKRSRERIVNITQGASDAQKAQLYEELRPEWKTQAANANEWFQKLQNGDFDSRASQIHNDFSQNPDLGFYADTAQQNGATPAQIAYQEGGEMVEKGSAFYAEVVTTVVGKALPGFEKGVEMAKKLNEKANKFKEYSDTYYDEGISGVVGKAFKEKLEGMGQNATVNAFGEDIGGAVNNLVQNTVRANNQEQAQVTVRNQEQEQNYGNIVAFNKDGDAPAQMVVRVGTPADGEDLTLPEGQFVVVAVDETGEDCGRNNGLQVTPGQNNVAVVEAVPPATGTQAQNMENVRERLQTQLQSVGQNGPPATSGAPKTTAGGNALKTTASTTVPKTSAAGAPSNKPSSGGFPRDGKWVLKAVPDNSTFTTDDGTVYYCDEFEVQFQVKNGQVVKMNSPMYGYISQDYAAGKGTVTLDNSGRLEVKIGQDTIVGQLTADGGSGTWVKIFNRKGKDYDGNRGTWTAERTGN